MSYGFGWGGWGVGAGGGLAAAIGGSLWLGFAIGGPIGLGVVAGIWLLIGAVALIAHLATSKSSSVSTSAVSEKTENQVAGIPDADDHSEKVQHLHQRTMGAQLGPRRTGHSAADTAADMHSDNEAGLNTTGQHQAAVDSRATHRSSERVVSDHDAADRRDRTARPHVGGTDSKPGL